MNLPWKRRPFLRPLAGMTITILILFLLSYFLIVTSSDNLKLNAEIIKITAMQRSLSQRIVNSIAADNLEGEITGPPLNNLIDSFSALQHVLLYGDNSHNIKPLKQNLILEYQKLDIGYNKYLDELDRNISNNGSNKFVDMLNAENFYLDQLDYFTAKLTGFSNEEIKYFQQREILILCISILLIFIEIKFIFLPAIKKITSQGTALREVSFTQAHTFRMPLTNIQGLLNLMIEMKHDDPYTVKLLTMTKKETDILDALIKTNVTKSDRDQVVKKNNSQFSMYNQV